MTMYGLSISEFSGHGRSEAYRYLLSGQIAFVLLARMRFILKSIRTKSTLKRIIHQSINTHFWWMGRRTYDTEVFTIHRRKPFDRLYILSEVSDGGHALGAIQRCQSAVYAYVRQSQYFQGQLFYRNRQDDPLILHRRTGAGKAAPQQIMCDKNFSWAWIQRADLPKKTRDCTDRLWLCWIIRQTQSWAQRGRQAKNCKYKGRKSRVLFAESRIWRPGNIFPCTLSKPHSEAILSNKEGGTKCQRIKLKR